MTENKLLMQEARNTLRDNWTTPVIITLIFLAISTAAGMIPFARYAVSLIIAGPFSLGFALVSIALKRDRENLKIETLFDGFKDFERSCVAGILVSVFTSLWMLLFIIPGIIAAISYSMTYFILAEDKEISAYDAIKKSKKMMYGYKWKYFCLSLRFIGWGFLCILTFGVGFLWLQPYMEVSFLNFYDDIKNNPVEEAPAAGL